MNFEEALNILKNIVAIPNDQKYDAILVKKLETSNTLDSNRRSNQTHIAITGSQMDMFPYISANSYLCCPYEDINRDIKNFFVAQVTFYLYKHNIETLNNSISFFNDKTIKPVFVSVWKRRDLNGEQIQLSSLRFDDPVFIEFRKLLHAGDYIIILKRKEKLEYDCFGLKTDLSTEPVFKNLNNKLFTIKSTTLVKLSENEKNVNNHFPDFAGENKIFYGVPGSGKSYYIEQHYSVNENNSMRVVFHPDYTYSDFVGQILPKIVKGENGSEDKLKYEFIPGPFTKILKKANDNPEQQFYLIIEELNRGNAPAIFGEIFQLLDRNENGSAVGESKYSITNAEIADIVFKNTETPIKIPANLSILATMNTSDQNVFTMDTAFQRRWIMVHIPNKFKSPQADQKIADSEITWKAFAEAVNDKLTEISGELTSTEDKRLGAYFAREADFKDRSRFAEKVLKYLWDDAFKMERSAIFKASFKTLSSVIEKFEDDKIENPLNEVLDSEIYKDICERMKEASSMQEQAQRIEE